MPGSLDCCKYLLKQEGLMAPDPDNSDLGVACHQFGEINEQLFLVLLRFASKEGNEASKHPRLTFEDQHR